MAINQREQTHKTMHALRQPLNALRLTLANLRHRISVDGKQLDQADTMVKLQKMDEQIQRMADLIDTLLVTEEDRDS
jgi:signal transduction histidine kinase